MNARWTVYTFPVECGAAAGAHLIPAGDPVRVIGSAIRRCAEHAAVEVDWAAIDAVRQALEARTLGAGAAGTLPSAVYRVRPVRRPRSFASIADIAGDRWDPKARAAGDRDRAAAPSNLTAATNKEPTS